MDLKVPPHAPISVLPSELLVLIFREVTRRPYELKLLALVCRSWHDIVLGTGELWTRMTIFSDTSEVRLRKQLELSGEALLVLDLPGSALDGLKKLASAWNGLIPIIERVSSLEGTIRGGEDEFNSAPALQPLSGGHCWPQLKRLVLFAAPHGSRPHLRAPNLEVLDLSLDGFRNWNYVGLGSALCDVKWMSSTLDMAEFVRAAARCPNLRRLEITAQRLGAMASGIPTDTPLWPKLAVIVLKCGHAALVDIIAILFNAPHLTALHLQFQVLEHPVPHFRQYFRPAPSLRELCVRFLMNLDNNSWHPLAPALLHGIFDLYDPAVLEKVTFNNMLIPPCAFPESCSQLQDVSLGEVLIPDNFLDNLTRCPLVRAVAIYESMVQENVLSASDGDIPMSILAFNGVFSPEWTQLQDLDLRDVVVHPEFMTRLAEFPHLHVVFLVILPHNVIPGTAETDWPEIDMITPLPALHTFRVGIGPVNDHPPFYSLSTPASRYIISAAVQLTRRMESGNISLSPAPLQVTDLARFLRSDRPLFGINIRFTLHHSHPETVSISFQADKIRLRAGENQSLLVLQAGIRCTELASAADEILNRYPLDRETKKVAFDTKETLNAVRKISERNPDAGGLQYLVRRAESTTSS